MANTKSAIKAARKAARLTVRNRGVLTRIKTLNKKFAAAIASGDPAAAKASGVAFISALDRAVKSGVVHRNAASRAKARAARHVLSK